MTETRDIEEIVEEADKWISLAEKLERISVILPISIAKAIIADWRRQKAEIAENVESMRAQCEEIARESYRTSRSRYVARNIADAIAALKK